MANDGLPGWAQWNMLSYPRLGDFSAVQWQLELDRAVTESHNSIIVYVDLHLLFG